MSKKGKRSNKQSRAQCQWSQTLTRDLARKKCIMAEECFQSEAFQEALSLFCETAYLYSDWPPLQNYVLNRLQQSANKCGKHGVFVDTSMKMLAQFPQLRHPALGSRILNSLIQCRKTRQEQQQDLMPINIVKDVTSQLLPLECVFSQATASFNDNVTLKVILSSNFPVKLSCSTPVACFNDPTYNCEVKVLNAEKRSMTNTILVQPKDTVVMECSITISPETKLDYLTVKQLSTSILDASGHEICSLSIPVDDDGTRSITSTKARKGAFSKRSKELRSDPFAATELSRQARLQERCHWLGIVPSESYATIVANYDATSLFGAAHIVTMTLSANNDDCKHVSLNLTIKDLSRKEDCTFKLLGVSKPSDEMNSSPVDITGLQFIDNSAKESLDIIDVESGMLEAVSIPYLSSNQSTTLAFEITCTSVREFQMSAVMKYTNAKNCSITTGKSLISWTCCNPLEVVHHVDYLQPNIWCVAQFSYLVFILLENCLYK